MNEIEQIIANALNLSQVNLDDVLASVGAFTFFILSLLNLRSKKEMKKVETVAEKTVEPVTEELVEEVREEGPASEPEVPTKSFAERLMSGLSKTRTDIWSKVGGILTRGELNEDEYEELEEILYSSDLSPKLVDELLEKLKKNASKDSDLNYTSIIKSFLLEKMETIQSQVNKDLYAFNPGNELKVIMIVGVNGAGKTTTIGKLATKLKNTGAKVVVGACDTFRAAAVEQLEVWCQRAGVEIVKSAENADPSGVAFDTVKKAKDLEADYCIIDTAGRLHTASNLMAELAKTKKVMSKVIPEAPHETLLVVDAITGQNALRQAQEFNQALELSGLVFTKCDGSSKAGSAVSIVDELKVPIAYIGVGEDVEDLDIFDLNDYLDALLGTPQ